MKIDNQVSTNVKKKSKRANSNYYISLLLFLFVVFIMISLIVNDNTIFKIRKKVENLNRLERQYSTIQRQNEQGSPNRTNSIDESYYIEKLARNQGMKRNGEIIISLPNRKRFNIEANEIIAEFEKVRKTQKEEIIRNIKFSRIATGIIFGIIFLYILFRFYQTRTKSIKIPGFFIPKKAK